MRESRHPEQSEGSKIEEIDSSVTAFPQNDGDGMICEITRTNPHPNPLPRRGNKRRVAFTLAEVLITLGIIGVVAAMTIPALINHYNKRITETRLEKFYSLFNQAIRLSVAENDEPEGWTDYWNASLYEADDDGKEIDKHEKVDGAFKKYLMPYMKVLHTETITDKKNNIFLLYFLADGSAFAYNGAHSRDILFYPKNAKRCIEKGISAGRGICYFTFSFMPYNKDKVWKYHYGKGLEPYLYDWNGNKRVLYTGSIYSCSDGIAKLYCTAIIKLNGWKIPSDYPLKIKY